MNSNAETTASQRSPRETSRLGSAVGRLAALGTIVCGSATVGACGARFAWTLELLCHFRVQYAVVLLVLSGVLTLVRRRRVAAVALALFGLNAWFVAPFLPMPGATPHTDASPDQTVLRLVSINVFSGNPTPERVVEFLREENPDVIVVLELTHDWKQRLEVLTATHPHQAVQSSAGNFGIGLYSRYPLEDVKFLPLTGSDAVTARITFEDATVRVIGAHPVPPKGQYTALRNRQLTQLAEYASGDDRMAVLAGDLNITPFSPYFDDLLADSGLRDPRRGRGVLTTWPSQSWLLRIPIDHCLVSEEIAATLNVGPNVGSDHLPLIAELRLRGSRED